MILKKSTTWKIKFTAFFIMTAVFFVVNTSKTDAAINPLVKFEGKVTNVDGSELPDGVYDFNFAIFSQPTGGVALWTENLTAANMFSAAIDAVTLNADSLTYDYASSSADSTLRVGQYLYNADTEEAALIIDFDAGADTVTVASGSPEWTAGQAINNRPYVEGGVIDINLGAAADLSTVDFNQPLYLQVTFNGEVMQPRKNVAAVYQAFESARLGGRTGDELAGLADNEIITGSWSFNNILSIATATEQAALTIAQNGNGKIVEFNTATGTAFAVFANGRVQIGDYYFPAAHGLPGYVLKTDLNGNLYWAMDIAGSGGGAGQFATGTDATYGDFIYEADTVMDLVIGNINLTGPASTRFEVEGLSWLDTVGVSAQNQLQFYDADSSNYFALRSTSTLAGNFILTLPAGLGAAGQALLTNADGNLYWGSPAGFTYVNAGAAGQTAYYAADGSTLSATSTIFISPSGNVGIGTTTPAQLLTVGQTSGSQFIVNALGQVAAGTWQGTAISPLYGGTGTTTAGWTALPFISGGVWGATTTLSALYGGTGFSSFNTGDLLYAGNADTLARLAAGGSGQILVVSPAGIPSWVSTSSLNINASDMTGIMDTAHGGTGQNFSAGTGFIYLNNGTTTASNTIAIVRTDLAASSGIVLAGNRLTLDATGNWSGTFDNQDGSYYLNAVNLNNFTTPFAWAMSATTTDALAQGAINKYYSTNLFAASLAGTTTSALAEGDNLYWTNQRFDTRLAATTSLPNLTVLANLAAVGTITAGTWHGDTLAVGYGGTGTTTFQANSIIYASAANTVGEILAGSNGYVLKMTGGAPVWQPDLTLGGEANFWATSSLDNLLIHPAAISQVVVIGADSTSTTGRIFEVAGDSLFGGGISAQSLSLVNALSVASGGTGSSAPSGILAGDGAGNIVSLSNNSADWNTAYSWGDHSTRNYFVKGVDIATVAMGGTGTTTFQANSLVFASAANTIGEIRAGTNGYALVMQNGIPTWSSTTPGVAHSILSSQHSDAEATTTVRGDLMSVDSSGQWNRLALGPDGYILRSNGTDASWMSTVNITSLGTITSGVWNGSPIDVAYGGTGATNATSARENLGLTDLYNFGITSTGTAGWLWQSDGDGRGHWEATTSLGIATGGGYDTLIGTTTYTTDGSIATSSLSGYQAANYQCDYEYPGSHFCRTHEILYTIQLKNITNWGDDVSNAWIAEGPPGYTYDSNDCNGYMDALNTKLGAFWLFNANGGGAGWLVNCSIVKPLACCKVQ